MSEVVAVAAIFEDLHFWLQELVIYHSFLELYSKLLRD